MQTQTIKPSRMTISDYQRELVRLRTESSNTVFDNDQFDHAKILISELANMASSEINIYSTAFCDTFFNDPTVEHAFKEAAKRGVQLNVITALDTETEASNAYSKSLLHYKNIFSENGVEIRSGLKLTYNADNEEQTYLFNNFMVVDGKGLRYEKDYFDFTIDCHIDQRQDMQANGCFNDPVIASVLNKYFKRNLDDNSLAAN